MPVQHKYRPKHLALAIALAVGCIEISMAQQPEPQVDSDTPTIKPRKKTAKPKERFDDLFAIKEFIGPRRNAARATNQSGEGLAARPVTTEPFATVAIDFDDAFYEFLNFPEPTASEVASAPAEADPFLQFQNDYTTQHTLISEPLQTIDGVSLELGDADDLLVINKGARWDGKLDGGNGVNGLLLNSADGGTVGETTNFAALRVAKGEWTLNDSNDFHKGDEVGNDATLFNLGTIKGTVYVDNGGTYGGYGKVGGLHVDGHLLVNASLGAPSIRGDLTLSESATLAYEVTDKAATSETIYVEGIARLGGASLLVTALPGDYAQTLNHTVISADRVEGTFGRVSSTLAFMTATPDYSNKQAVRLTYARNEVPIENLATNENGRELARSIEEPKASPTAQTPPNTANAAVTALIASTTETASQAIDQLDGSQNANLAKATLNSDSPISSTMLSAMRQLDSASRYSNSSKRNAPRLAAGSEDNGRVWLQALGHGGTLDRDFDALKHTTHGLVLGADWGIDEEWRIGVMSGKSETRLDSRGLDGDLDSWHLGAYALRQNGPMSLRLGATYSNHDASTKRRVAFKGFSDRPEGRYDANTQQAFAELGYNLGQANVSIEPFASLGYQRYQRDTYTEKGGAAALKVQGQSQNNLNSTFGLRLAKLNTLDNGMQLTPRFSAGWKHTYGDVYSDTRQRLVTGGKNFSVSGASLDRDSLLVDAGLDLGLSAKHTLGVGLTGEIGTDSRNHGVTGQWRMSF
jgi:outer membrane autotransporter protein